MAEELTGNDGRAVPSKRLNPLEKRRQLLIDVTIQIRHAMNTAEITKAEAYQILGVLWSETDKS